MFYVFNESAALVNWFEARTSADTYAAALGGGCYVRAEPELTEHERARADRFAPYIRRHHWFVSRSS